MLMQIFFFSAVYLDEQAGLGVACELFMEEGQVHVESTSAPPYLKTRMLPH